MLCIQLRSAPAEKDLPSPASTTARTPSASPASWKARVNSATNQIGNKRRHLEQNDELIRQKEVALIAKETSTEDRIMILADLKDLSEENGQLDAEIVHLIEERAMHEHALASYEAVLADSGY